MEDRDEERVRNEDRMELGIVLVVGLHLTSNHRVRSDPDRQEDDERGTCETEGKTGVSMLSVGSHDPPRDTYANHRQKNLLGFAFPPK